MTPKREQHYSRPGTFMGWSESFVVLCFAGMWFLWPGHTAEESRQRPATNHMIYAFEASSDLEASSVLLNPPSPVEGPKKTPNAALIEYWPKRERYLPRSTSTNQSEQIETTAPARALDAGIHPEYSLDVTPSPTFTPTREAQPRLLVQISGQLEARGFRAPAIPFEEIETQKNSWQVSVLVEAGADGTPDHVFLESGSGDEKIDTQIVRIMYSGRVSKPGKACSGIVVVSFGKQ